MHHIEIDQEGEEKYEIELVHHTQKKSWDCGLSCIMMILPKKKRDFFTKNFDEICEKEGFGRSTWTIDLCYLLKRFSIDFIYHTTVIGVNPEHKSQFFYEKILHKDRERVTKRFRDANKNGIEIKQKSVKAREIIRHLRRFGPVILLINAGYLKCDHCKRNNFSSEVFHIIPKSLNYHGHYVVLCGYNLETRQFYYRNPAYSNGTCAMEISAMNKARLCYGTDEDCIFIFQ